VLQRANAAEYKRR